MARDFSARIMRGDRFGIVGPNGAGDHPLLDRAKRVFDRLAASVENVWPLRYAGLHSIQNGLVLKTRQKGSSRFSRARIMAVQAPVSARSFSCRSRADLYRPVMRLPQVALDC